MKQKKLFLISLLFVLTTVLLLLFSTMVYAADANIIIDNQNQWNNFIDRIINTWSGDNNNITLNADVAGQLTLPDDLTEISIEGNNYSISGSVGSSESTISATGRSKDLTINLKNITLYGITANNNGYPAIVSDNSEYDQITLILNSEGSVKAIGGDNGSGLALSNSSGLYAVNTNVTINGSPALQSGAGDAGAGAYISTGDLTISSGSPQFFSENHNGLYIDEGSLIIAGEAKPVFISLSMGDVGADINTLSVNDEASPTFISTGGSAISAAAMYLYGAGDCVFMGTEYGIKLKENGAVGITQSRGALIVQATMGAIQSRDEIIIELPDSYTYWTNSANKDPGGEGTVFKRDNPFIYSTEYIYIKIQHNLKPPEYTVTFDSNGGSAVDSAIYFDGEQAQRPASPVKDGFAFAGWYLDSKAFDFGMPITENITLIALWEDDTARSLSYILYIALAIVALLLIILLMLRRGAKRSSDQVKV